jgi:radical SAM superfamily enzyme YgiQ (UPF0313 family)
MRVLLINPDNPVVSLTKTSLTNKLNRYRIWKPLGLHTIAAVTPDRWQVEIADENLGPIDYDNLPRPDLIGITAFTSQATRAYQLATRFREQGITVVMGGIHASMCPQEALSYCDAIVTGEAEQAWPQLLEDFERGAVKRLYEGGLVPEATIPIARHDLTKGRYHFGSVQTVRGCPLRCTFCSVTAFNGGKFRHRPLETVIAELHQIPEKLVLFVDDNLIGTRRDHIDYSKALFRRMIEEKIEKKWICQATINFADDDELLTLARQAGCVSVFIGFEATTEEGLVAVHKKFNIQNGRDFRASVRNIQKHGIVVVGSFIMGIDTDKPGIGLVLDDAARRYGVDMANVLMLTPLPGTELWREMLAAGRIAADNFPEDWQYYTLCHPVANYKQFTWTELVDEMNQFNDSFYSYRSILERALRVVKYNLRSPLRMLFGVVGNLTYRYNQLNDRRIYQTREESTAAGAVLATPQP